MDHCCYILITFTAGIVQHFVKTPNAPLRKVSLGLSSREIQLPAGIYPFLVFRVAIQFLVVLILEFSEIYLPKPLYDNMGSVGVNYHSSLPASLKRTYIHSLHLRILPAL